MARYSSKNTPFTLQNPYQECALVCTAFDFPTQCLLGRCALWQKYFDLCWHPDNGVTEMNEVADVGLDATIIRLSLRYCTVPGFTKPAPFWITGLKLWLPTASVKSRTGPPAISIFHYC